MTRRCAACLVLLLLCVQATVTRVYDGDTFSVVAAIWPDQTWAGSVRVNGVDTPEIRGQCPREKVLALAAREFTRQAVGERVTLHGVKLGKYARRVVADVETQRGDLTEMLIRNGHGRPYDGKSARRGWCEAQ